MAAVTILPSSQSTATVSISHTTIIDNHSTPHIPESAGGLRVAQVKLAIYHSIVAANTVRTVPFDPSFDTNNLPTGGQTRVVGIIEVGAVEVQPALAATGADAVLPIAGRALALGLGILLLLARRRVLTR